MQTVGASKTGLFRILNATSNLQKLVTVTQIRSYYKKKWTYDNKYMGQFDYHDQNKYPRGLGSYKEEELLDDVHTMRRTPVENPSPFHIITRVRGFNQGALPWHQQVVLRRLNIHSSTNGDVVIVPNTPQFNALINKIKHLIVLKPALFANGQVPKEDDIGALKVCPWTGVVEIDEKLRLRNKRLDLEKPLMFQGNFLRAKLGRMYGSRNNHHLA